MQEWRKVSLPLKKYVDDAEEAYNYAVRAFFDTFKNLLGQAASGYCNAIVSNVCVGGLPTNETSSDVKA